MEVDEDSIIKIILNTYKYVSTISTAPLPAVKEHIGYIVDRTDLRNLRNGHLTGAASLLKSQRSLLYVLKGVHYTK